MSGTLASINDLKQHIVSLATAIIPRSRALTIK